LTAVDRRLPRAACRARLQNRGSESYNIITLSYDSSPEGEKLRAKVRAARREGGGRTRRSSHLLWAAQDIRHPPLTPWPNAPPPLQDEAARQRAIYRSESIYEKNHAVPHNIITGEHRSNPFDTLREQRC